jgi:hypothetical protein
MKCGYLKKLNYFHHLHALLRELYYTYGYVYVCVCFFFLFLLCLCVFNCAIHEYTYCNRTHVNCSAIAARTRTKSSHLYSCAAYYKRACLIYI